MPSADSYTDHRLVNRKVSFTFKSPPKRKGPQTKKLQMPRPHDPRVKNNSPKMKGPQTKKLQVPKLHDPRVKNNLQVMLQERLQCVTAAEPEEQWKQVKTILQETMAEVVCLSTRKHQD